VVEIDWRQLAAIFVVALLILLALAARWRAWRRSRRAKRRGARAVRGEHAAETLLKKSGYEILDRQISKTWTVERDGESVEFLLRADLRVRQGDCEFIAEVKTGDLAPNLSNAATRRQILEYSIAFESPIVLLVDVERGNIHEVEFPAPETIEPSDA